MQGSSKALVTLSTDTSEATGTIEEKEIVKVTQKLETKLQNKELGKFIFRIECMNNNGQGFLYIDPTLLDPASITNRAVLEYLQRIGPPNIKSINVVPKITTSELRDVPLKNAIEGPDVGSNDKELVLQGGALTFGGSLLTNTNLNNVLATYSLLGKEIKGSLNQNVLKALNGDIPTFIDDVSLPISIGELKKTEEDSLSLNQIKSIRSGPQDNYLKMIYQRSNGFSF